MDKHLTPHLIHIGLIIFTLKNFLSTFGDNPPRPYPCLSKLMRFFLLLFNLFRFFSHCYNYRVTFLTGSPLNYLSRNPFTISGTLALEFWWDLVLRKYRGASVKKKSPCRYRLNTTKYVIKKKVRKSIKKALNKKKKSYPHCLTTSFSLNYPLFLN